MYSTTKTTGARRRLRRTARLGALLLIGLAGCARGAGVGADAGGSDGDGGGGGGTIDPPTGSAQPPFLAGLRALLPGADALVAHVALPAEGFETALFVSQDSADVFGGAPALEDLQDPVVRVDGLAEDLTYFVGLAVRPDGASEWTPAGLVLEARTSPPIYVDAAADPDIADGTTPDTAYSSLFLALLVSIQQGGANVFVRDGDYAAANLPVIAGTHVYGGFQAGFDLELRDPFSGATVLGGSANAPSLDVQGGQPTVVLDGLLLDGGGAATVGVDVTDTDVELRAVVVTNYADRGVRLRNGDTEEVFDIRLASCHLAGNGADGLSGQGGLDLRIDGCSFDANVQEGLEVDDLIALDGEVGRLQVRGSRFLGNGAEGLDVDLAAPIGLGSQGGYFDVDVEGCLFEGNAAAGLLIDQDYELIDLWDGDIRVRGCTARGNGAQGIRFDADAPASALFHRCLVAGNAQEGLWISSESDAGLVLVSATVALGNQGAGLRASLGNKAVAATHLVLAGNLGGGFVSDDVESSAVSSVAYLQDDPWQGVRREGCVEVVDPFDGSFELAPEAFGTVVAQDGADVTLADADVVAGALPVELADDGIARTVLAVVGDVATLDPAPETVRLPALFMRFPPGDAVTEDWRLPASSPLAGAGFAAPGAPAVDPGPFGSPLAGTPGLEDEVPATLYAPLGTSPALTDPLGSAEPLRVVFPLPLSLASLVPGAVRAIGANGDELAIDFVLDGDDLVVTPPPGGWGGPPVRLELHRSLESAAGDTLATPLVLPLNR